MNGRYRSTNYGVHDNIYEKQWTTHLPPDFQSMVLTKESTASMDSAFGTDTYRGGYLVIDNDEHGLNSGRSDSTKASIEQNCNAFVSANPRFEVQKWMDPTDRGVINSGFGMDGYSTNSRTDTTAFNPSVNKADIGGTSIYGGPCAWCRPGLGAFIPAQVPLPWIPGSAAAARPSASAAGPNAAGVATVAEAPLSGPPFDIDPGSPRTCANACNCAQDLANKIPVAIQPNGGVQLLWREAGTNICRVTYFDAALRKTGAEIKFEATDVGGLVAYDDGTCVLVSQMDCTGPATFDPATAMNRSVVIMWRKGVLKWATRLTDPYEGAGTYVARMHFAQFKRDGGKGRLAAYHPVTGGGLLPNAGGGHWGSTTYVVDEETGKRLSAASACSHDIGGRLASDPQRSGDEFVTLCAKDGNEANNATGGTSMILRSSASNRGGSGKGVFFKENSVDIAGWSSCRIAAVLPFGTDKMLLAYASNSRKKLHDLVVRVGKFDTTLDWQKGDERGGGQRITLVSNEDSNNVELYNFHMMPYDPAPTTAPSKYLVYYESLNNATCCGPSNGSREGRCYGVISKRTWTKVEVAGTQDGGYSILKTATLEVPVTQTNDSGPRMVPEEEPVAYPDGALLWATFRGSTETKEFKVAFHMAFP